MVMIVADTTSGLPGAQARSLGIPLVPQIVVFGDESFRDDSEMDTATFLKKLKASSQLPKTSAPPPPLYAPIFAEAMRKKEDVIVIAPSAKVSGTVRSAEVAAQDHPELKVHVVDTQTIAGNLATLVLLANQWAQEGATTESILGRLEQWIPRGRLFFLVNTLEYLQKGGRIGGAKALVGELLQVKPILNIQQGQVEPFEQQRTKKRALARIVEIVEEQCPRSEDAHLCVMQIDAQEEAGLLAETLRARMDIAQIPIYELPPAIAVHGGPGALAVGFFVT